MHPDVTSDTAGTCPKCGMRLVPTTSANGERVHMHEHRHDEGHGQAHDHGAPDGLEWEDLMPEINAASNAHNMIWQLVDVDTGKQNWEIDWAFRVGDLVKIRVLNDMDQDHPMHHPFHIHGAGPVPHPRPRRRRRVEPRLEGHGARTLRRDRRHPARGHQPRACGWRTATSPNTTRPG